MSPGCTVMEGGRFLSWARTGDAVSIPVAGDESAPDAAADWRVSADGPLLGAVSHPSAGVVLVGRRAILSSPPGSAELATVCSFGEGESICEILGATWHRCAWWMFLLLENGERRLMELAEGRTAVFGMEDGRRWPVLVGLGAWLVLAGGVTNDPVVARQVVLLGTAGTPLRLDLKLPTRSTSTLGIATLIPISADRALALVHWDVHTGEAARGGGHTRPVGSFELQLTTPPATRPRRLPFHLRLPECRRSWVHVGEWILFVMEQGGLCGYDLTGHAWHEGPPAPGGGIEWMVSDHASVLVQCRDGVVRVGTAGSGG